MPMSNSQKLALIGGGAGLFLVVLIIVFAMQGGGQSGPEWGGKNIIMKDVQAQITTVTKFKGLDLLYQEIPSYNILSYNQMIPRLDMDQRQVALVGQIELALTPEWREKLGACNKIIQDAYTKYREAQARGDGGTMNVARQELADGVAQHKRTLDELGNKYRQAIIGNVLDAEQQAKFPVTPTDRSPMPKL